MKAPGQKELFLGVPMDVPPGFSYREDFMTTEEEAALLDAIAVMPLQHASYRQWTAKRRIVSFGGAYDFTHHELHPAEPIPGFLEPLRDRIAGWAGIDTALFSHATIAEYAPAPSSAGTATYRTSRSWPAYRCAARRACASALIRPRKAGRAPSC